MTGLVFNGSFFPENFLRIEGHDGKENVCQLLGGLGAFFIQPLADDAQETGEDVGEIVGGGSVRDREAQHQRSDHLIFEHGDQIFRHRVFRVLHQKLIESPVLGGKL